VNLIETAPHEFNANFNFDGGLQPYFALNRAVKDGGGTQRGEFGGKRWEVTLYYQSSNIVNPGERTQTGTRFSIDEIREFRLSTEAVEDDGQAGERAFNCHIRPRWRGMQTEDRYGERRTPNIPFEEGINVRVQGSTIEFRECSGATDRGADQNR